MTEFWVLAADASHARLFHREKKFSPLVEVQDWLHAESRMPGRDLENDRQGKTFSSFGYNQSDNQKATDPKKREAQDFARELGDFLDAARARGEFTSLSVVADPSFLGFLRDTVKESTLRRIERAVPKNMTRHSAEDIARALDNVS